MHDPSNPKMVMFYGTSALTLAGLSLILYLVFNYSTTMKGLYWGFVIH